MSQLKELWTKIARFAEAMESMDDPSRDYTSSLRKRVDKLEHEVKHLESQLHSRHGGRGTQQ